MQQFSSKWYYGVQKVYVDHFYMIYYATQDNINFFELTGDLPGFLGVLNPSLPLSPPLPYSPLISGGLGV
jgi:hypothetical protein